MFMHDYKTPEQANKKKVKEVEKNVAEDEGLGHEMRGEATFYD